TAEHELRLNGGHRAQSISPARQMLAGLIDCAGAGLVDVVHHTGDQAGGDRDHQDVIAGVDVAVTARRRTQAIEIGVADIVAAIRWRQVSARAPAITVITRLDPIIAVARRIPIAVACAAIIAEFGASAPPVAVVAAPAVLAALILTPVAMIRAAILAPVPAVVAAILTPVATVVTTVLPPLTAIMTILGLRHHGSGRGRQRQGDDGGLGQAVHVKLHAKRRNPVWA